MNLRKSKTQFNFNTYFYILYENPMMSFFSIPSCIKCNIINLQYIKIMVYFQNTELLQSPLLGCIMGLLHALWKHNLHILIDDIRHKSEFWKHVTSPIFHNIEPGHKTYGQLFNILGLELFNERENIHPALKTTLESFFDISKPFLRLWLEFIFSFKGRDTADECPEFVPTWLSLLTSWKDFTTIFCKCLPISLNIAHKTVIVPPCMTALLNELRDMRDGRLVVLLAELYVIMLANWKEDCFDDRKANSKQIDSLLNNAAVVYDDLHPRAKRAIISIGTVAINTLDYEIKANSTLAHSIIKSVTNINNLELEKLFDDMKEKTDQTKPENAGKEEVPPIVLSLAMLEQCLDLYDDAFSGLAQWFESSRFVNKLLFCLHVCLHKKRHSQTCLAALRCLTAYARGPFSKDLLSCDVDQFLWLPLLPPKLEVNGSGGMWKPEAWWKMYAASLDFISMMLMRHGQFFAGEAITFVGVHLEYLVESVQIIKSNFNTDRLNLCASTLNLVVQLVKYEERWRKENITSMIEIIVSLFIQNITYIV